MESNAETTKSPGRAAALAWALLTHRRLPVIAALVGLILVLPALSAGLILDDYFHEWVMQGRQYPPSSTASALDMFRFLDGDPNRTALGMDRGLLPWWTYKEIKVCFFRPLTVLTHWIDYRVWPECPSLMHAHSLLWFGAMLLAAGYLYRRVMGPTWIAGLAAILYAVADDHAIPASWLAGRNAAVAGFFGIVALLAHDCRRRDGRRSAAVLAPLLLLAGLLSAEAGIGTCAYLAAYAMFVDKGTARQRLLTLIPYAIVVIAWRVTWSHLGYGVANMGIYVDPVADPARFLYSVVLRAPVLLMGQWALPPSEVVLLFGPGTQLVVSIYAALFVVLLAVVLVPLIRRDRVARFWATGMMLSLIPICATFSADRLLVFTGIGAMGLLAQFLAGVFEQAEWRPRNHAWRTTATTLGCLFVLIHLVIGPALLSLRARFPMGPEDAIDRLFVHTPLDASVTQQDVVIVNPPSPLHAHYLPILREIDGKPTPLHTRVLAPGAPSVRVSRPDARTLVVRPEHGYLAQIFDRLFRSEATPLSLGERIELTGMSVEVSALTDDGRPAEARFRFAVPLEDRSLRWLVSKNGEFVAWTPPPVGQSLILEETPPF